MYVQIPRKVSTDARMNMWDIHQPQAVQDKKADRQRLLKLEAGGWLALSAVTRLYGMIGSKRSKGGDREKLAD